MASRAGPDNSMRFVIAGTLSGVTNWAVVQWVQCTVSATPSQADIDSLLGSWATAWETNFLPVCGNSTATVSAKATYFVPGGTVIESVSSRSGSGSGGTGVADLSACTVVSWLSGVYWRGGKPRSYLPNLMQAAVTNGSALTGAAITAALAKAVAYRTAVNALTHGSVTGVQLGFVSFVSKLVERPAPVFFPITGAIVHTRIGTQRRRLGKWKQ